MRLWRYQRDRAISRRALVLAVGCALVLGLTAPSASAGYWHPGSLAFWNAKVGAIGNQGGCGSPPTGRIRVTEDSGHTYRVVRKTSGPILYLDAAGSKDIWAEIGDCGERSLEGHHLIHSSDRGETWARVAGDWPFDPSFASPRYGLGVGPYGPCMHVVGTCGVLLYTSDGGATWHPRPDPCNIGGIVSLATRRDAWALCGIGPFDGKAIYRSRNQGRRWTLVASSEDPAADSGLRPLGAPTGMSFLPNGTGMYGAYGELWSPPQVTIDGGRHWTKVGPPISATFQLVDLVSPRVRFTIDAAPNSGTLRLHSSTDYGRSWQVARRWLH